MFNKKEIFSLIIALIILTFVFGFNDKSEVFVFTNWLSHFLYVFFVVLIVLFVKELGHKVFALWRDCDVKFEIWSIKSLWFSKASELSLNPKTKVNIIKAIIKLNISFLL